MKFDMKEVLIKMALEANLTTSDVPSFLSDLKEVLLVTADDKEELEGFISEAYEVLMCNLEKS